MKSISISSLRHLRTPFLSLKIELSHLKSLENGKDVTSNESLKLYADVKKISSKDVSLVTVRDHTQNTLNMAIETKIKVV